MTDIQEQIDHKAGWPFRDTHHNTRAKRGAYVDIRDTGVNMHANGMSIMHKNLFQEHAVYLARFDVGVRHEVTFRALRDCPAKAQAFLFSRPGLNEHVSGTGNFGLDSSSKFLSNV